MLANFFLTLSSHAFVSAGEPGQSSPPVQVLDLEWLPAPHVTLQAPHTPHGDQLGHGDKLHDFSFRFSPPKNKVFRMSGV